MFLVYLDENRMEAGLFQAFRRAGIEVSTPLSRGMLGKSDEEQLEFAALHGEALYTSDEDDFPRIHKEWLVANRAHAGIIIVKQQRYGIGEQTRRLLRLMNAKTTDEMRSNLEYLSNW